MRYFMWKFLKMSLAHLPISRLSIAVFFAVAGAPAFAIAHDNQIQNAPQNLSANSQYANECALVGALNGYSSCGGSYSPVGAIMDRSKYIGARSDPNTNATVAIDLDGYCRYIDNGTAGVSSVSSIFVPFSTSTEWTKFIENVRFSNAFITLVQCFRPFPSALSPSASWVVPAPYNATIGCVNNSVAGVPAPALYMPSTNSWPASTSSFSCHGRSTTVYAQTSWTGTPVGDGDTSLATSWVPTVNYGPDLTLTATAPTLSGTVSGPSITALAGKPITLTWATSVADRASSSSSAGRPSAAAVLREPAAVTVSQTTWRASDTTSGTWTDSTATSGSVKMTPSIADHGYTITYTMTATGDNGVRSVATAVVNVEQPIQVAFSASPNLINPGDSSTLRWSVVNNSLAPIICLASEGGAFDGWAGSNPSPSGGSFLVSPSADTKYTLACSDILQTYSQSTTVDVGTYSALYAACPSSCGYGGGTISPIGCTRSDGTAANVRYCASKSMSCPSTGTCVSYAWSDWSACSGGAQSRSCNGTDGSEGNDPSLCGGGAANQSCTLTATVWVQAAGGGNYAAVGFWMPQYGEADHGVDYFPSTTHWPAPNDASWTSLYNAAWQSVGQFTGSSNGVWQSNAPYTGSGQVFGGCFGGYGGAFADSGHAFGTPFSRNCGSDHSWAIAVPCSYVSATSTGQKGYLAAVGWDNQNYPDPFGPAGTKVQVWYCGAPITNLRGTPYFSVP
jgi:hypothetical protein